MNYPLALGMICLIVIVQKAKNRDAWLAILAYWVILCIKNFVEAAV